MVVENNDCGKFVTEELWYNIGCGNVLNTDGKGIGTRATPASKLDACIKLRDQEVEVVVEVDMQRSEQVRRWWPFLRDRRIEAYDDLTRRFIDK